MPGEPALQPPGQQHHRGEQHGVGKAPRTSGEGLPLKLMSDCAAPRISATPTTEPNAVPFTMAMVRLVSGGTAMRNACGITTSISTGSGRSPSDSATSVCPRGTARMAAKNTSSAKAASTALSATKVARKPDSSTPAEGRPKNSSTMITSGGTARNRSTANTRGQLTSRQPGSRSTANRNPANSPAATTSTANSTVTPKPRRMSGTAASITFRLKKVNRKPGCPSIGWGGRQLQCGSCGVGS